MEPIPSVSVIVPTKNRSEMLRRFLPLLAEQTIKERFEIIVVDNGSTDNTEEVVRRHSERWPYIRYILEDISGSAVARHTGALSARSPLLIFVDDDMRANASLLKGHLAVHRQKPGIVGLGNIISEKSARPFERMLAYIYDGSRQTLPTRTPMAGDYWSGNVSLARDLYFDVGGYNPVFGKIGYGLDIDFGKRLLDRGVHFVFVPDAIAYHSFSESFPERLNKCYRSGIAYGFVKENFPDLPIPEVNSYSYRPSLRLTEFICRFGAAVLEPFDRGSGTPMKVLAFVYDLGIRCATKRGILDSSRKTANMRLSQVS